MKRVPVVLAAIVAVLVSAGSALAATNSYSGSYSFHGGKGTSSKPAPIGFTQIIQAKATTAGARTNLLHDIKTTIAGVKIKVAGFPTCSLKKIASAQNDTSCKAKALIATGAIKASVGAASPFLASNGQPCDPVLHVWNAGQGKLAFFFVDTSSHQCLSGQLHTGSVAPFPATYKQQGSKLAINIPIPNTVDYPAGQSANLTGSLSYEKLNWISQSMGSKHDIETTGCSGKRAWTFGFTDSLPSGPNGSKSISGSAACG